MESHSQSYTIDLLLALLFVCFNFFLGNVHVWHLSFSRRARTYHSAASEVDDSRVEEDGGHSQGGKHNHQPEHLVVGCHDGQLDQRDWYKVKFLKIISPTQDSPKDRTNGLIHLCKPTIFTENAKKAAKKRRKNEQWGENVLVRGSLMKKIAQL